MDPTGSAPTHDDRTLAQFGPQAQAYLTSTVHAQGADLADIAERLKQRPQARVLDLGCGAGHLGFAIAPHVREVVSVDLSEAMLGITAITAASRGLGNLHTQRARAEALPFPDASFDVVCTRFSAHHWRDLAASLCEARRVLNADGCLYVIDVVGHADALVDTHLQAIELLRDPSHVRDRSVAEWNRLLRDAGFALRTQRTWKLPIEFDAWIARMRTPAESTAQIRALLDRASQEVRDGLAVKPDGSFELDAAFFDAVPVAR